MGTSNFYNQNASKVYAVLMDETVYRCTICNDYEYDKHETCLSCGSFDIKESYLSSDIHDWEAFESNLYERLKSLREKGYFVQEGGGIFSNLRSFEGKVIATISECKTYMGVEVEIQLVAILRSGYYEGANLDWELTYFADGYENDEEIVEEWEYQAAKEHSVGLVKMNRSRVEAWVETNRDRLVSDVETIFEEMSTPLRLVGRFSNGEAIYESA